MIHMGQFFCTQSQVDIYIDYVCVLVPAWNIPECLEMWCISHFGAAHVYQLATLSRSDIQKKICIVFVRVSAMLWFSCFLDFSLFFFCAQKGILLWIIKCRNATCSKRYLTWKRDLNVISIVCSAEDDFEMTG